MTKTGIEVLGFCVSNQKLKMLKRGNAVFVRYKENSWLNYNSGTTIIQPAVFTGVGTSVGAIHEAAKAI